MTVEEKLSEDIQMEKVYSMCTLVSKKLNIKEQLKLFRELSYSMVYYVDEKSKGVLYMQEQGRDEREEENKHQATRFQRILRDQCDFLEQSLVDYRTFEDKYIERYNYAGPYLEEIKELKERIQELEEELNA